MSSLIQSLLPPLGGVPNAHLSPTPVEEAPIHLICVLHSKPDTPPLRRPVVLPPPPVPSPQRLGPNLRLLILLLLPLPLLAWPPIALLLGVLFSVAVGFFWPMGATVTVGSLTDVRKILSEGFKEPVSTAMVRPCSGFHTHWHSCSCWPRAIACGNARQLGTFARLVDVHTAGVLGKETVYMCGKRWKRYDGVALSIWHFMLQSRWCGHTILTGPDHTYQERRSNGVV